LWIRLRRGFSSSSSSIRRPLGEGIDEENDEEEMGEYWESIGAEIFRCFWIA
jgi:hypothetical protein